MSLRKLPRRRPAATQGSQPVSSPAVPSRIESGGRQRLHKVLAAAGIASRRDCEKLIASGRVTVDGEIADRPGISVDPMAQVIQFDGEVVHIDPKVYWLLHKPAGVLATTRDPGGRPTVLDLVPAPQARLFPVGRLDEQSTGLMLLTNDGELAQRLTHPRFGAATTYEVLVADRLSSEGLERLREGVWSEGGIARPRAEIVGHQGRATRLKLTFTGGHNREIRRLLASLGHKCLRIHRVAIGPVKLRKLPRGHARPATAEEVRMLRTASSMVRSTGLGPKKGAPRRGKMKGPFPSATGRARRPPRPKGR